MKLSGKVTLTNLAMVNRIVDARSEQLRLLDVVRAWQGGENAWNPATYCITIDGQRQDDAMLALARPVIEQEIRARIAAFDRDLEALGVDVGRDG